MSNSDFLNLVPSPKKNNSPNVATKRIGDVKSADNASQAFVGAESAVSPSPSGVIERTIHTIHRVLIYPNGQMWIKKSQTWMDKKGMIVKKKEKKAPVKVKKVELQKTEEY